MVNPLYSAGKERKTRVSNGDSHGVHSLKVTILVDNEAGKDLAAEHGLALWIETGEQRILLDTVQNGVLVGNAERLGVDLAKTDALVLSHGHYDHTGGMAAVLKVATGAQVLCHPSAVIPRYRSNGGRLKPLGMPCAAMRALDGLPGQRMRWVQNGLECFPGIGLTGSIPRTTSYEDTGGAFYLDPGLSRPDPIDDDMALWVRTGRGLVVCVGCCHAGLINTLEQALRQSQASRLHAVIGGLHLLHADDRRIETTVNALKAFAPDLIVPCHCTGRRAVDALKSAFGAGVVTGVSGAIFDF